MCVADMVDRNLPLSAKVTGTKRVRVYSRTSTLTFPNPNVAFCPK